MFGFAWAVLRRDLMAIAMHRRAAWAEPLVFFTIVMILFPLAGSMGTAMLKQAMPMIVWVSVLFANFLALERLLKPDFADGSLEQLLVTSRPLALTLLFKVLAYWLAFSLPLVVLAPFYSLLLFLPVDSVAVMVAALAIGTLAVNLVGSVGAALVVDLQRNSLLSGLLVMPFYIPTLVFGAHATYAASIGLPVAGQLAMLLAILILALLLAPFAAALALRVSIA